MDTENNRGIIFAIPSSSGWRKIECRNLSERTEDCIHAEMCVSGDFWNRQKSSVNAEVVPDFKVVLHQVFLDRQQLTGLRDDLAQWMENYTEFERQICSSNISGQRLAISLGRSEQLIYSKHKPALCVKYDAGSAFSGQWAFVIDQSCINLFIIDLDAFLLTG